MNEPLDSLVCLDNTCAPGGVPIRLGEKHPHKPVCEPMDKDWKNRLLEKTDTDYREPGYQNLADALVNFGGEFALIPSGEPDIDKLRTRGQLWGATHRIASGSSNQCHANSCRLWDKHQDRFFIATGYALSQDGLWRQHTWCVEPARAKAKVIETTKAREMYFGFVMTLEETLDFGRNNGVFSIETKDATRERYALASQPAVTPMRTMKPR